MITQLKNNLGKPDSKKWKLIADIALYVTPFISTAIMSLPISDNMQKWVIFGLTMVSIVFKAISKFTTDETQSNS